MKQVVKKCEPNPLLKQAREIYSQMERNWVVWASVLYEIRESRAYAQAGYRSFDAYCVSEFPFSSSTISKALNSYERFRPSGKHVQLSFDCLYRILSIESKVTPEKFKNLSDEYLAGKLSPKQIRSKVEEIKTDSKRTQGREEAEVTAEIERELEGDEEEFESIRTGIDSEVDNSPAIEWVFQIENHIDFLIENLGGCEWKELNETQEKMFKEVSLKIHKCASILSKSMREIKSVRDGL